MIFLFILFSVLILGILGIVLWAVFKKTEISSLDLALLHIKVPQPEAREGEERDIHKAINFSEQLFSSLLTLKEPFVFEAAVKHDSEEIYFYAAVPRERLDFASRQIQGLFPEAQVDQVDDYNMFVPSGTSKICYLTLKESSILPLRTYEES